MRQCDTEDNPMRQCVTEDNPMSQCVTEDNPMKQCVTEDSTTQKRTGSWALHILKLRMAQNEQTKMKQMMAVCHEKSQHFFFHEIGLQFLCYKIKKPLSCAFL